MSKTKKLDIFNLFYSGAAVVILIGVIAKLLEWPAQDILITSGLAIEAIVFGVSAIRFVEVKKNTDVATEATLSKMAEGLGNLSSGVSVAGNGKGASGNGNSLLGSNSSIGYLSSDNLTPNYSESSWKLLEQMDILTLTKDMFYHPSWVNLKLEEYAQLTQLFKKLFDKKLPSKDALPFLIKFPVAFPISEVDMLALDSAHVISLEEMEILWKSLNLIGATYLFEKAVIEQTATEVFIRPKKEFETQIFGGESAEVIVYAKKYHATSLIISPVQYYLQDAIILKEIELVKYLIAQSNIKDDEQVILLSNILNQKPDEIKILFWDRFDKITYDSKSGAGYLVLKAFVNAAAHFQSSKDASNLLLDKLEVITNNNEKITRNDVVNFSDEIVYFGNDKEYNVKLNELFSNGELAHLKYFEEIINKLAAEEVLTKDRLNQIFNLIKQDTVEDLLKTLNRHLAKTKTEPTGAQLSFVLLCKVFINS
jgi:hypothetical protein